MLTLSSVYSQNNSWRTYVEQLAEEGMEENSIENIFEELSFIEQNPFDLNLVKLDELERFPLLSYDQSKAIVEFVEKNKPIYSVYELRNIYKLDFSTVELILPFFYVGDISKRPDNFDLSQFLKYAQHNVQIRFDKTLNKRAGYKAYSDSILEKFPNRKYVGEDFYHSFKYSLSYCNRIQAGIVAEKDAGEPFWKNEYKKGYDYYSFHLVLRDIGVLKTLALGDYRLSFGQGLVINNDFTLGKGFGTNNIAKRTIAPKRHFSTAENGFFRGIATTFRLKNVDLTAFYSNNSFDSNLSDIGEVTSFKTDGYNRVPLDMSKRNNTREQVAGANLNYKINTFQVGFSGLHHIYNRVYNPTLRYYNEYYWRGRETINMGVDYSYRYSNLYFAGETARSRNGTIAHINTIEFTPFSLSSFTLSYRNYPATYHAMHARAFGDGSRVQNEEAIYVSASIQPIAKVKLFLYSDFIKFPEPKFNVNEASSALDLYGLATYNLSNYSFIEVRYKFKRKYNNTKYPDDKTTVVLPNQTNKFRFRYSRTCLNGWYYRTTLDFANYQVLYFPYEQGYMISQNIGHRGNKYIHGDGFIGFFDADTNNARLYSYERNILNTFYMPSFYGKGVRGALSLRLNIRKNLSFSLKYAQTLYLNRDVISSGTEQIEGNTRSDIYSYLVWKF